jgi:hypothetical protein
MALISGFFPVIFSKTPSIVFRIGEFGLGFQPG